MESIETMEKFWQLSDQIKQGFLFAMLTDQIVWKRWPLFQKNSLVRATGGGCYELPLKGFQDAKIRLRNYLGYYEESGQAYVRDWRLTDVFQEER